MGSAREVGGVGEGSKGKLPMLSLHLRDEENQNQSTFINPNYHLGSYNLLLKRTVWASESFYLTPGFFYLLALKKIN